MKKVSGLVKAGCVLNIIPHFIVFFCSVCLCLLYERSEYISVGHGHYEKFINIINIFINALLIRMYLRVMKGYANGKTLAGLLGLFNIFIFSSFGLPRFDFGISFLGGIFILCGEYENF